MCWGDLDIMKGIRGLRLRFEEGREGVLNGWRQAGEMYNLSFA